MIIFLRHTFILLIILLLYGCKEYQLGCSGYVAEKRMAAILSKLSKHRLDFLDVSIDKDSGFESWHDGTLSCHKIVKYRIRDDFLTNYNKSIEYGQKLGIEFIKINDYYILISKNSSYTNNNLFQFDIKNSRERGGHYIYIASLPSLNSLILLFNDSFFRDFNNLLQPIIENINYSNKTINYKSTINSLKAIGFKSDAANTRFYNEDTDISIVKHDNFVRITINSPRVLFYTKRAPIYDPLKNNEMLPFFLEFKITD